MFVMALLQATFRSLGPFLPELTAGWAERLFSTPRRFPQPPREHRWLAGAERSTVEIAGFLA